jgi:PAS domain S-box-containing protein
VSERPPSIARGLHEAAWPDVLANLQTAYSELAQAQFELERRAGEIEDTRDLFQRVIESMSEALFLVDHAGRVIRTNPAAGALLGCDHTVLQHRGFAEVCRSDRIAATPWQLLERAPGGAQPDVEAEIVTPAGGRIAVSASCGLVRDKRGKIMGLLIVMRDITDRKRAEHERAKLLASAQAARAEAEAANRAKDEFLAILSHELRTPLGAILGWTRMLRNNSVDAASVGRALQTIERNARAQAQLVEDLLDVSRIITGKLALEMRVVELQPIIAAALDVVRPAADAKGIRLEATFEALAGFVSGDAARLQQIVWNLLSNAVKFTASGGQVRVRLQRVDGHVRMTVADTGQGIRADFLPHVFDRFRQADSSSTRAHGGLGLGLAIVRQLVELHGGTVDVTSDGPGKGAIFGVNLPLMADAVETAQTHGDADADQGGARPALDGLRLLVVDDQADQRELVTMFLQAYGAQITGAASAAEAIAALERAIPDVLVSDIAMPHEDGYELIRRIRALERETGKRIPALALTAYTSIHDARRARVAGFDTHVGKPVEPEVIAKAVATLAGRRWPQSGRG